MSPVTVGRLYMQTTNLLGWSSTHQVYTTLVGGVEVGYVVTLSGAGGEMAVLLAKSTFLDCLVNHGDETLHFCGFSGCPLFVCWFMLEE